MKQINTFEELKLKGDPFLPCPRCRRWVNALPAMSRLDSKVKICKPCGNEEGCGLLIPELYDYLYEIRDED